MGLGRVFFEPPCPWLVLPLTFKFRTFSAPKCPLLLNMPLVFAAGLHATSLPPETAPRLFQLRGVSAPEFKPAGFGVCISSGFGIAPVRVWPSAGTAPGRFGDMQFFLLLHFSPSSSLSCIPRAAKRKTLCVSCHTFLHPPQMPPSCSSGEQQLWVGQVPRVSSIEPSRPAGDRSIPRETVLGAQSCRRRLFFGFLQTFPPWLRLYKEALAPCTGPSA